jgi:hypothetical protein
MSKIWTTMEVHGPANSPMCTLCAIEMICADGRRLTPGFLNGRR